MGNKPCKLGDSGVSGKSNCSLSTTNKNKLNKLLREECTFDPQTGRVQQENCVMKQTTAAPQPCDVAHGKFGSACLLPSNTQYCDAEGALATEGLCVMDKSIPECTSLSCDTPCIMKNKVPECDFLANSKGACVMTNPLPLCEADSKGACIMPYGPPRQCASIDDSDCHMSKPLPSCEKATEGPCVMPRPYPPCVPGGPRPCIQTQELSTCEEDERGGIKSPKDGCIFQSGMSVRPDYPHCDDPEMANKLSRDKLCVLDAMSIAKSEPYPRQPYAELMLSDRL